MTGMNDLMNSLRDVSSDPNAIPAGTYEGILNDLKYVHSAKKNSVALVFEYKVVSGDFKGATISQWFELGTSPEFDQHGVPVSFTPTMTAQQLPWFKKAFVDVGVAEDDVAHVANNNFQHLKGTSVEFGVKVNGQWRNVSWVNKADKDFAASSAPQSISPQSIGSMDDIANSL